MTIFIRIIKGMERTLIQELPKKLEQTVLVKAHVHTLRKLGKMTFLVLRDYSGFTQAIVPKKLETNITPQSVVSIVGKVNWHKESQYDNIEIFVESVEVISLAEILPIAIHKPEPHSWHLQYQLRPITLRQLEEIAIFKLQAVMLSTYRNFLNAEGFSEISSTKISQSGIEGGAEMFEVNFFEQKLLLTQSPQFYKQMMVGSLERVYEIGKVYRAEGTNSNRHLAEYIGLDLEMGFIESGLEVIKMENAVLNYMFLAMITNSKQELKALNAADLQAPGKIPVLHYNEVVEIMKSYNFEIGMNGLNHAQEKLLGEHVKREFNNDWCFIYPYPTALRPFYAMPCKNNPEFSETFELIYKGLEVTSGGQRIHEYKQLREAITAKGLNPESFESYLMPFKYGMPPHGGFGIGLERIMMQMLNLESVEVASLISRTNQHFLH